MRWLGSLPVWTSAQVLLFYIRTRWRHVRFDRGSVEVFVVIVYVFIIINYWTWVTKCRCLYWYWHVQNVHTNVLHNNSAWIRRFNSFLSSFSRQLKLSAPAKAIAIVTVLKRWRRRNRSVQMKEYTNTTFSQWQKCWVCVLWKRNCLTKSPRNQ